MILFADTSALIKLYIEEDGSARMAERSADATVAASVLAYAEVHSTFARRRRESLLTDAEHADLVAGFEDDWQGLIVVALRPAIAGLTPRLVRNHPLRGADAVHLASALTLRDAGIDVTFAGSDLRLVDAAETEGLEAFNPASADAG